MWVPFCNIGYVGSVVRTPVLGHFWRFRGAAGVDPGRPQFAVPGHKSLPPDEIHIADLTGDVVRKDDDVAAGVPDTFFLAVFERVADTRGFAGFQLEVGNAFDGGVIGARELRVRYAGFPARQRCACIVSRHTGRGAGSVAYAHREGRGRKETHAATTDSVGESRPRAQQSVLSPAPPAA